MKNNTIIPTISWKNVDAIADNVIRSRLARGLSPILKKTKIKPYIMRQHAYDYDELLYVDAGRIIVTCGQSRLIARQGDIFMFSSGLRHGTILKTGDRASIVVIYFANPDRSGDHIAGKRISLNQANRSELERLLAMAQADDSGVMVLPSKRVMLFAGNLISQMSFFHTRNRATRTDHETAVKTVLQYMDSNLERALSLGELADAAHLSRWHLSRIFHQITGRPLKNILREKRIEKAKKLLMSGRMNVTEVATACGFATVFYFSRVFTAAVGMPPSEYAGRLSP